MEHQNHRPSRIPNLNNLTNMSPFSIRNIIGTFLLFACCFANSSASAHPPRAREMQAIVQSIDYQKRILMLNSVHGSGPQKLVWNADTSFLRDGKLVSATELKAVTHVMVYYHSPFFGKPVAVKVVCLDKP